MSALEGLALYLALGLAFGAGHDLGQGSDEEVGPFISGVVVWPIGALVWFVVRADAVIGKLRP